MAQKGKFGTMGGVYTPSVLTILGVIMYMRLSWVVGNAGTIFSALLIILMAHVVSITTGLSVSSIATDKKIKGGGIYYMLSRSLGFPIGGAIGVTIFVATALSISLYLIGFSESMLQVTKDWFGIEEITTNHLRIAGSVALVCIVTIAYISTSVAIKTQYIILGLIALSLVSVFMGTSEGKNFAEAPIIEGADKISFAVLFGIFFPAVTGFTAGVAMSGDLRNPKISIPWGTMLAIATGLVIYIGLTFFVFNQIPLAELQKNTNVLVEFSWIPQFVIAGIWGATLSSALGGILGGPRILQAMSSDSITPKYFVKGVGKNNEPRRALIFTFILAQVGILIGELDVIAGIVTMFYMAAYLFINVSCFLEQWASPDFRPSFRIPLIVSLLGTIATFLLMIQLDIVAAIVSVIVMALIFLWLTRKQLELGSGDVWQSVWSSVVKLGLKKLSKKQTHERNWEPNILLFSGGTKHRPYLLEICKSIAGRNGMISNFDLIENTSAQMLFPKSEQLLNNPDEQDSSIFFRRQECKNIYQGIETIAQTYGFSGVEPNTVLMGWANEENNRKSFLHMTNYLHALDYNILFVNFDEDKGFGDKQKIDIWWRDLSHVSYLTVQLCKFLISSKDWRDAQVRFIYLNNENSAQHTIKKAIYNITKELKDYISIEIINNEIQNKSFGDVVKVESKDTDLTLIDIPNFTNDDNTGMHEIDTILSNLNTVILINASSKFNKGRIVNLDIEKEYSDAGEVKTTNKFINTIPLIKSKFTELNDVVAQIDRELIEACKELTDNIFSHIGKSFNVLSKRLSEENAIKEQVFNSIDEIIDDIQVNRLDKIELVISDSINNHIETINNSLKNLPAQIKRQYTKSDLEKDVDDNLLVSKLKDKLSKKTKLPIKKINIKKIAVKHFKYEYMSMFSDDINLFGYVIQELNNVVRKVLNQWKENKDNKNDSILLVNLSSEISKLLIDSQNRTFEELFKNARHYVNMIVADADVFISYNIIEENNLLIKKNKVNLDSYAAAWHQNSILLLNQLKVDFALFKVKYVLLPKINRIHSFIYDKHISYIKEIARKLSKEKDNIDIKDLEQIENNLISITLRIGSDKMLRGIELLSNTLIDKLPTETEIITQHDLSEFDNNQIDIIPELIDIQRIVQYLIDNNIIQSISLLLQQYFNEIQIEQLKIENAIKLLQFNLSESESKTESIIEVHKKIDTELEEVNTHLDEINERLSQGVQRITSQTRELLTDEIIWSRAEQLNGIIRKKSNRKGLSKYTQSIKKLPNTTVNKVDSWIVKGRDLMTQASFQQRIKTLENPHAKWRDFMDKVSLSSENKKNIPFYYQQLFIGRHKAPSIPVEHREYEWKRFNNAYRRFKEGNSGALLFTGEYFAGSSFLIENICNVMNFQNVVKLDSPAFYYTDVNKTIDRVLKSSTAENGTAEEIINQLPKDSVIIIEDIELWWTRTEKGNDLIIKLLDLIKKYSTRFLFIISCNIEFYKLIRKLTQIDDILQETIFLQALKIEQIKDAILKRHLASGIKIQWRNKEELGLSVKLQNQIMRKLTGATQGNVGFAFYQWLSSFSEVKDGNLVMNDITNYSLPDVNMPEWDNMLLQLMLHKQLTYRKLIAIYKGRDRFHVETIINSLLRTGIVVEIDLNIYQINPFAVSYVQKHLRRNKYID